MGVKFIKGTCKALIGGKWYDVKDVRVTEGERTPEQQRWRLPIYWEVTLEFQFTPSHRVKDGGMVMLRHLDGSYCTRPKSCRKFHDWQWQGVGDG